jgi:alcohol dehydrogenase, propanol-preferring
MLAFQIVGPHSTEVTNVPEPEPRPGEVLIRVGAAGACHSDLHNMIDAPAGSYQVPLTLGHENAGWIEALGPGVAGWEKGQAVAIYGIIGCGRCPACLQGRENECRVIPPGGGIGITRDGGMAEYVTVPASRLVSIGDLDMAQAAPLTDAGLTPYHAIQLCRDVLVPGATCVVIGIGGLGHMAIQILAGTTAAQIIAVDVKPETLKVATQIGAHQAIPADENAAKQIRSLVGPQPGGADVVLDFVGADSTLALAASVVSIGGRLALVGLAGGQLRVSPSVGETGIPFETRVVIPFWGTKAELAEVIALARSHRISPHVEQFPLHNAHVAYDRLRAGQLSGRAVVMPAAA